MAEYFPKLINLVVELMVEVPQLLMLGDFMPYKGYMKHQEFMANMATMTLLRFHF